MITDPDRFKQDRSPYERPNFPYRCGRIGLWSKPCGRGPSSEGQCGGVAECRPFLDNGRWSCRRSARSGGPCEDGPRPDGSCCHQHPPCKPIISLRGYRGRLTFLAAALIVALISAFAFYGDGATALSSVNPGPLSGGHQNFTAEEGCATCHKQHGGDAGMWLQASWSPGTLSQSCESCHAFSGPATSPHNETFKTAGGARKTECTMCHTEHKGTDGKITQLSDSQCSAWHDKQFKSFSDGHPNFSSDYPSRRRTAIVFDHSNHFNKHFENAKYADRAPKDRCIACHNVDQAARNVPVRPFEEACARCHEDQIAGRELVLFTLPEFEENPFDDATVGEACGPTAEARDAAGEQLSAIAEKLEELKNGELSAAAASAELLSDIEGLQGQLGFSEPGEPEEEYESVSTETLPPTAVLLLGIEDGEDIESYTEPVRDLIMGMIENGEEPLVAALEERGDAKALLSDLSPELVRGIACAWASNVEYEAPAEAISGGWFADALSLKYQPLRHADTVSKSWLNLAAAGGEGVTDDLREMLLSRSEGPGACTKCHSVSQTAEKAETLRVEWAFGVQSNQRHLSYSHGPHLNLLGPGASCETCHKLNAEADYAGSFNHNDPHKFVSNFNSIENATCTQCHAKGQVRQECTLCHEYHNGNKFKRRMMSASAKYSSK